MVFSSSLTASVSVSDEARVTRPSSDSSPPSHDHSIVPSLLHVRHRHHPDCARSYSLLHHHHPRLPQTEEAVEKPEEVQDTDKMHSLFIHLCVHLVITHSLTLSTERWRPRRWALCHRSSCWIDSTPTPCTSGFPCCWTQSSWPSSIPEIISNMLEILEREPSDGFSKPGERGRWSRGERGGKGKWYI